MSKKSLKFLVVGIIFAIPAVCGFVTVNGSVETGDQTIFDNCSEPIPRYILGQCRFDAFVVKKRIERTYIEQTFAQQCKDVSGVDIDLKRNDRLYKEYEICVKQLVDPKQLNEDVETIMEYMRVAVRDNFTFSDQQKSVILTTIETYCPNVSNIIKCDDKLQPILNECDTPHGKAYGRKTNRLLLSVFDFVCGKDAQNAIQFINEKFIDCITIKMQDLNECWIEGQRKQQKPSNDEYADCNAAFESYKKCNIQKMKQCPRSIELGTFTAPLWTYFNTYACDEVANVTSGPEVAGNY